MVSKLKYTYVFIYIGYLAGNSIGQQFVDILENCSWVVFCQKLDNNAGDRRAIFMTQPFIPFLLFEFFIETSSFYLGTLHACHGRCVGFACEIEKPLYIEAWLCSLVTHIIIICSLLNLLLFSLPSPMVFNWLPPPNGTLKVNVHGVSFGAPMPNGNTSGLGVVLRTSDGNLVNCVVGTIPGLDPLSTNLWDIVIGLRRAFLEGAIFVILETNNMDAFGAVQFAHLHQHLVVDDLIHQIVTRIRDSNWTCDFRLIYSVRNNVATYASLLGGELFCMLYLFLEPIERMAELMDFNMGLGPHDQQFLETPMVEEEWKYLKRF